MGLQMKNMDQEFIYGLTVASYVTCVGYDASRYVEIGIISGRSGSPTDCGRAHAVIFILIKIVPKTGLHDLLWWRLQVAQITNAWGVFKTSPQLALQISLQLADCSRTCPSR